MPIPTLGKSLDRFVVGITVAWLTAIAGCNAIGFDITEKIPEQTIQGSPIAHMVGSFGGDAALNAIKLNVDLASETAKRNGAAIKHVRLKSLVFTITNTANPDDPGCFDFVDEAVISIASSREDSELLNSVVAEGSSPGCVQTFVLTPHPEV